MADSTKTLKIELMADSTSFEKGFVGAGRSVDKLSRTLEPLNRSMKGFGDSFTSSSQRAGAFADSLGRVSTTLARSADAFGLPVQALRTLDDVSDVAELGLKNLTTGIAGFNAATLGIVGAGAAIGAALGTFANRFEAVRTFADQATKGLYDFLAANKLFGESTRDAGAGMEAGLRSFSQAMGAKNEEALKKQVAQLKAQGKTVVEIAAFYKGRLSPALQEKLGLTEKDIEASKKQAKAQKEAEEAAKREAEAFEALVAQLSGKTAQEEVDKLAAAVKRLGVGGVADLEALRKKLEQLQQQGAKITDKGLLGVLRGGKVEIPKELGNLDLGVEEPVMDPAILTIAQEKFNGIAQAAAAAGLSTKEIEDALEGAGAEAGQVEVALGSIPVTFGSEMKKALAGLPQVILGAIQGGGDVGKAIGAHLGGSILEGLTGPDGPLGKALADKLGKTLGGALGSILPGLGSIIGSGIGSIISKGFSAIGHALGIGGDPVIMAVNDMRDAFFEAEGGWLAFSQKMAAVSSEDWAKKIFDARTVEEFNRLVAEAKGLLDTQGAAQAALDEATKRYGFTLEELGPAMQRQQLDAQAGQLLQDFKLLTASGIGVGTVLGKMGSNLSEFVNASKAAGQAVPEAMRPMIEAAIKNGQLLDENGQAYTSAEQAGITFAQTMTQQFQTLIEKIDAMVSALTGIPPVTVPVNLVPGSSSVPEVPVPKVPEFQTGGVGDFGSGTLAMLHGREWIIPEDQMGGGFGGTNIQVTNNVGMNPLQTAETARQAGEFVAKALARRMYRGLADAVSAGRA